MKIIYVFKQLKWLQSSKIYLLLFLSFILSLFLLCVSNYFWSEEQEDFDIDIFDLRPWLNIVTIKF